MNREPGDYTLAIILLNWNNPSFTIECLESLMRSHWQYFKVIVIDNGSEDDSIEKLSNWSKGNISSIAGPYDKEPRFRKTRLAIISGQDVKKNVLPFRNNPEKVIVVKNETNEGFARGNNLGIQLALKDKYEYILLQNNDTTLEPDCLETLYDYMYKNAEYGVITPKINYYGEPDKIWYCGGRLNILGRRLFFYRGQVDNPAKQVQTRDVSLITGCSIFVRREIFHTYGLLSERFFFGQEDYEFSLDMRRHRVKMALVGKAKTYHMVSATRDLLYSDYAGDRLPDMLVGYLNRFVSRKLRSGSALSWYIWKWVNMTIIAVRLKTVYRTPLARLITFMKLLSSYSATYDSVDKDMVFSAKEKLG